MAVETHFQQFLEWLNLQGTEPGFRPLQVLDRGSYGWVEFVEQESCRSIEQVRRFYERQGAFAALLYALEANDLHSENLVAAGEHPVPIDLESLFQPVTNSKSRSRRRVLEQSIEAGWRCGIPLAISTPGLMTGLAGIGYQLLRLAEPEFVPSVLSLAGPRCGR